MVLGVEEANGEDRHWHSDCETQYKVEDGHATLPGKRHGTLYALVSLSTTYPINSRVSVISGLPTKPQP